MDSPEVGGAPQADAPAALTFTLPSSGATLILERFHVAPGTPAWSEQEEVVAQGQSLTVEAAAGEMLNATLSTDDGKVVDSRVLAGACAANVDHAPRTLQVPAEFASIQEAIDRADYGDTVRVAAGTYHESLELHSGVRLVGAGAFSTILEGADGDPENLIDFTDAHDVLVEGFTLRGVGQAEGCSDPNDVLACSGNWYRAAVYADGHDVVDDADPCNDASILLMHNVIEGNDIGMMIYFQPYAVVRNNLFVGNRVGFAANHHGGATALVTHNVFFGQADEALAVSASYLDVTNNIIAHNGVALEQEYAQRGRLRCNVLFGNDSLGNRFEPGVDGNLVVDPLFVDPAHFDFQLQNASQALFAGCLGADDGEASQAGAFGSAAGVWPERVD